MSDFQVFDELPDCGWTKNGRAPHPLTVEFAAAMKANPGRWVRFPNEKRWADGGDRAKRNGLAQSIRGCRGAFKEGGFEAQIRVGSLFGRWLPPAA